MLTLYQKKIKTKVPITYTSNTPAIPWEFSEILKKLNGENYFSGRCVKIKTNFGDECVFHIRGKNPSQTIADNYIKDEVANPAIEWMAIGIARHETGTCEYAHFNKRGAYDAGDSDIKFTPNEAGDGGLGLFQLTNTPTPENRHFWSWKINSNAGIQKLKACHASAITWMKNQRRQAAMAKKGIKNPFTKYAITFGEGKDYPMEHAVALKAYNGLGAKMIGNKPIQENGYHFCYFDENNQEWVFKEIVKIKVNGNLISNCYVKDIIDAYLAGEKK